MVLYIAQNGKMIKCDLYLLITYMINQTCFSYYDCIWRYWNFQFFLLLDVALGKDHLNVVTSVVYIIFITGGECL